ncbi:MAG: hypothetical protein WBY67_25485 [Pseudolabrys sp.]
MADIASARQATLKAQAAGRKISRMEGSLGRGFGQVPGWVRRDPQAVQIGAAESGGKTWRKKIGGTGVAVHSTVMVPVGRNIIVPPP